MESTVQDTLEDVAIGGLNVWVWFGSNWNIIVTTLLTSIYLIYKIRKERHAAERQRAEKDLFIMQSNDWQETKKKIEELETKVR